MRAFVVIALLCLGCRTARQNPEEPRAQVTELQLQFDEGKGDLRFNLHAPGLHGEVELHWQLQLDGRPLASGVAVVTPVGEQIAIDAPVHLKGVRYDEGARRVRLLLSGDAVVQGELLANPVAFSVEKEVVLVGAPMP